MNKFVRAFKARQFDVAKPIFIGGEGRPTIIVDLESRAIYQQVGEDLVEIDPSEVAHLYPSDVLSQITGKEPPSPAIDLEEAHRPPDLPERAIVEATRLADMRRRRRRSTASQQDQQ